MTDNQERANEYLMKIRIINKRIIRRRQEIEALKLSATGVVAVRYDKDRVQTSPQNYMEIAMADAFEKERENEEDAATVDDVKMTAYQIVRVLPEPEHRTMLEHYFFNGCNMEDIAVMMNVSERTAYDIKSDALEEFGKRL